MSTMNKTSFFKPDETLGAAIDFSKPGPSDTVVEIRKKKMLTITPPIVQSVDGEPIPPGWKAKTAGHHWLEKFDCDGHSGGLIVLQWNPVARRWSISGNVGAGNYVETKNWKYVAYCPMPGEDE